MKFCDCINCVNDPRSNYTKITNIKTASIEDLKQNLHVTGLLDELKYYAAYSSWFSNNKHRPQNICSEIHTDDLQEFDGHSVAGKRARAKLQEWE